MKKNCLLVLPRSIFPVIGGYAIKNKELIKILNERYNLSLVVISDHIPGEEEEEFYSNHSVNHKVFVFGRLRYLLNALHTLFTSEPLQVGYFYFNEVQSYIDSILSRQVQAHTFEKDYLAVLEGIPDAPEGVLADLLTRDAAKKQTFVTHTPGPDARSARLSYRVLGVKDGRALVRIRLETGRTHQIRVHLAWRSHPIVGDMIYGHKKPELGLNSQCLHAAALDFIHPRTGKPVHVECELPDYFTQALSKLEPL